MKSVYFLWASGIIFRLLSDTQVSANIRQHASISFKKIIVLWSSKFKVIRTHQEEALCDTHSQSSTKCTGSNRGCEELCVTITLQISSYVFIYQYDQTCSMHLGCLYSPLLRCVFIAVTNVSWDGHTIGKTEEMVGMFLLASQWVTGFMATHWWLVGRLKHELYGFLG